MSSYADFLPSLRFQRTLAVSPDGSQVAYVDDSAGQFNLVVQSLDAGEPRRLTSLVDSAVGRVFWRPDGKAAGFVADSRGDENTQLIELDVATGEQQSFTDEPNVQFEPALGEPYSPDGTRLAYAGNDVEPGRQDVLVRELATGRVRRIYDRGGRVFAGYWSPDGTHLTVADWREGNNDHVIYLVPAGGGEPRRVSGDVVAAYWLGPWMPDGSRFLVMTPAGRDVTGLAVMDAATGDLTWLDASDWEVEELALSRDGRRLVWTVNVEGRSQLRGRDLTSGADLQIPKLPPGVVTNLTLTPDGQQVVMLMSTPTRPANVTVYDLASGELTTLTDARPAGVAPAGFVEPRLVHFPARDGHQLPANLYRPAGGSGPIGVVLAIHGGPPSQDRLEYTHDGFFQYLVSHGVAVFAPNVRGSSGYGIAYEKRSYRDWGGQDLADFADAAAYLHAQHWVDPARIGLVGRSYGGFAVLSCISRLPDYEWAAAVDWCGPANLVTFTRSQPPTWRSKVAAMIGDPDTDADFLLSRSPVTYVDQIRTPLLVIQGANDPRVPRHESDQIVARLRQRGVEVRYDVYDDEGHSFSKRANQTRAWSTAGEFLLSHLARSAPSAGTAAA
jgi:dipeptidyl aminopeptidase/acylaminoacyl peptidase